MFSFLTFQKLKQSKNKFPSPIKDHFDLHINKFEIEYIETIINHLSEEILKFK